MDVKVDLSKFTCGPCWLLPTQHMYVHLPSRVGQPCLQIKILLPSLSLSSCGMNFEASPLSAECVAIIPELLFLKFSSFLLSIYRIDPPLYLPCVSSSVSKPSSPQRVNCSDGLRARGSTLLCGGLVCILPLAWVQGSGPLL